MRRLGSKLDAVVHKISELEDSLEEVAWVRHRGTRAGTQSLSDQHCPAASAELRTEEGDTVGQTWQLGTVTEKEPVCQILRGRQASAG